MRNLAPALFLSLVACSSSGLGELPPGHFSEPEDKALMGGTAVAGPEFDFQVAITDEAGEHACSGVILDDHWVLTDSQCANTMGTFARVGVGSHTRTEQALLLVDEVQINPTAAGTSVGLLHVSAGGLTDFGSPATLATTATYESLATPGTYGAVAGWGPKEPGGEDVDTLQRAELPILDPMVCDGFTESDPRLFCAGFIGFAAADVCGDLGAPISVVYQQERVVLGLTYSEACNDVTNPSVFMELGHQLDFIRQFVPELPPLDLDPTEQDDHGDTIDDATHLHLPGVLEAELTPGDTDVFRFELTTTRRVRAESFSDIDPVSSLIDEQGNVIATNDDGGVDLNFYLDAVLQPGTYFLQVQGWNGLQDGPYRVEFDSDIATEPDPVCSILQDADQDLDGLPDAVDPNPADLYGTTWLAAGSAVHQETHPRGTVASTWDGRILIGSRLEDLEFENTVSVFRPEVAAPGPNGLFDPAVAVSPAFDLHDPVDGNLHVTVFPNAAALPATAHGANPYWSDAGETPSASGTYQTYKLGWIGVMDGVVAGPHAKHLMMNSATIVVKDAHTATAAVYTASFDGVSTPLTSLSGDHLWRYEPSVSLDGRLLFWNGLAQNSANGTTNYAFNPDPMQPSGWSEPATAPALYSAHGAGSPNEPVVDGLLFSERYPLASQPMRDPDGTELGATDLLPGPYPWLSPDATDLFVPIVSNFRGALRSGLSVVGVRSNWTLRHVDGALNPCRGELSSDGEIHFVNSPEGGLLEGSYRLHTLGDGSPLGPQGYDRILMSGAYQSGSMWSPFLDVPSAALPRSPLAETFGFFTSTRRFGEVSLPEIPDGHFLLSLPMTEQLFIDRAIAQQFYDDTVPAGQQWALKRQLSGHLTDRTVDASGYNHTVRLNDGAAFPYEYHDAVGIWTAYKQARDADPLLPHTSEGVSGDRIEGIVGQAVFFPGGSSVRTNLTDDAELRLATASGTTAALWVKPQQPLAAAALMTVQTHFWMRISSDQLRVHWGSANFDVPFHFPQDAWTHLAVRTEGDRLDVFIDGALVDSFVSTPTVPQFHVTLGPYDSTPGTEALYLLDEVSLSDVARTPEEIRAMALQRAEPSPYVGSDIGYTGDLADWPVHLPESGPPSAALVALGESLFQETALSLDHSKSCASCHREDLAFADDLTLSEGIEGRTGDRNTPTLFNRGTGRSQFTDGRAASLEDQALQPIDAVHEFDLGVAAALERLAQDPVMTDRFEAAFGTCEPSASRTARALGAYVRSLQSPPVTDSLTAQEARGRALFTQKARCTTCHNGPNLTDEGLHNVGLDLSIPTNEGRAALTGRAVDLGKHRTPTLRGVGLTAPYFHDGSRVDLAEVIDFYNDGGDSNENRDLGILPLGLEEGEKLDLEAYLLSL